MFQLHYVSITLYFHGYKTITKALFLKNKPDYIPKGYSIFTPEEVTRAFQ